MPNVIPMELPHQMPPLVIDHFDAPKAGLPPHSRCRRSRSRSSRKSSKRRTCSSKRPRSRRRSASRSHRSRNTNSRPCRLLKAGSGQSHDGTEEMRQNAERLSDTLQSFGIEAHIINVTRGPSVTRYELELQRGVKLSKVTNLADDIALALGASGVRTRPSRTRSPLSASRYRTGSSRSSWRAEVIVQAEFEKCKSRVSFAVGKDIAANRIIGGIGKLPHLLIAGTTGSGKSVCMNSLIISLLYKAKPEEVKLIMIDPKMGRAWHLQRRSPQSTPSLLMP